MTQAEIDALRTENARRREENDSLRMTEELATMMAQNEAKRATVLEAENERLREALRTIPLGRLYCGTCGEYDHDCGCIPSIIDRTRLEAMKNADED